MNNIHISSLAYNPLGFTKPQTSRVESKPTDSVSVNQGKQDKPARNADSQPSNPEDIKAVLDDYRLKIVEPSQQPSNIRNQKAVNAYLQTLNQPNQVKVADLISGIDLYA